MAIRNHCHFRAKRPVLSSPIVWLRQPTGTKVCPMDVRDDTVKMIQAYSSGEPERYPEPDDPYCPTTWRIVQAFLVALAVVGSLILIIRAST